MEIWKEVQEYEGIYEVSNTGKVRSMEGKTTNSKKHGIRIWEQRVLKPKLDKKGYQRVSLYKDKKAKTVLVHRLVAMAFCEKQVGKDLVNHMDGNVSNNYYTNLEWCSYLENNRHAFETGLMTTNTIVSLVSKETGEEQEFNSLTKGSCFLGKNHGYLSRIIKEGKTETDKYFIVFKALTR